MTSRASSSRAESTLIHTKLVRPAVPSRLVERPRLLARLDDTLTHRVTLVSTPPGFGKTTLAAEWLEQRAVPSAWLALDRFDSDPERFVLYLVAAIEGAMPGRFPATTALLAARNPPPFTHLVETLIAETARIQAPLVLVLEDYHAVASNAVHEVVERMVAALPASVHLLVLTRVDPPWPRGHWLGKGWMCELRARDLRFSLEEAQRFFALEPERALSEAAIGHAHARTEGWIAGLRLVELSLRGAADPDARAQAFSGSDRLVADYLITEVLASQSPEARAFLEATAPLDRFSARLADHLLAGMEPDSAREILDRLERDNLFVVPLDADRQWYRYHHLFQDLLLHNLPSLASAERRAAIDRGAAEWFASEGLIEEALRHWIVAGEIDAAAAHLAAQLGTVIDEDISRRLLARLIALFPEGAEHGRLPLLVAHVYLRGARWDTAGIVELVAEIDALGQGQAGRAGDDLDTKLLAAVDVHRAGVAFWSGDAAEAARIAGRALEVLPRREWDFARTVGTAYRALALSLTGQRAEGLREVERAAGRSMGARRQMLEFVFVEALIHLYASQMDEVDAVARRMLVAHDVVPAPPFWLAWAHYLRGVVAYEHNQLEGAAEAFERVTALRYLATSRLVHDALVGLTLVARARGAADSDVKARAADARAYALEAGDPVSLRITNSLDARVGFTSGERRAVTMPPPDFVSFWLEVPSLTFADRLLRDSSAESRDAALQFIEQAREQATQHYNVRQAMALSLLRVEALSLRGEEDVALKALGSVVRQAEPLGLVRTFCDRGPRLMRLVSTFAARAGRRGYLDRLLSAYEGEASTERGEARPHRRAASRADEAVPAGGPGMVLSNREIDVLELLAERLSNKEIAARLGVSPQTIKVHTRRIYEKLAVHGRHEAVAAARASGLIGPH